jgi:hypothetical protein
MPSVSLSTRVPPAVHARLVEIAAQRRMSLAALTADILATALEGPQDTGPRVDGPLVAAVLHTMEGVTAPTAVVCRETALELARAVEGRMRSYPAAAAALVEATEKGLKAQEQADAPPFDFAAFLGYDLPKELDGRG